jgi:hypothetical protein
MMLNKDVIFLIGKAYQGILCLVLVESAEAGPVELPEEGEARLIELVL